MTSDSENRQAEEPPGWARQLRGQLTGFFRRRVRDQQDVPDLVQDVYVRLSARDDSARQGDNIIDLRRYMFRTAASVLTDKHRRDGVRQRDAHIPFDIGQHDQGEPGPDRALESTQILSLVLRSLDELPEKTRTIFVLHRIEGWPYRDIAEQMGISRKAVEKQMSRAIRHIAAFRDHLA